MNIRLIGFIFAALTVFFSLTTYSIDERERGILFTFKEISETDIQPGLHFRIPVIQTVRKFPAQILMLDARPDDFLTSEKKYVTVDFFVKWKIGNAADYFRATRGGDMGQAKQRLEEIMKDALRNEFSKRTIQEAISGKRGKMMTTLQRKSNESANKLGIDVIDVRVSRIDLPDDVSESVYRRMRTERERVAKDFRAKGREAAERIRAKADREATIIVANAYRDSQKIRGQGDAKAASIYANTYGGNAAEFYNFYRSMSAYENALGKGQDLLVLEPDTEFFKYFRQQKVDDTLPKKLDAPVVVAPTPKPIVLPTIPTVTPKLVLTAIPTVAPAPMPIKKSVIAPTIAPKPTPILTKEPAIAPTIPIILDPLSKGEEITVKQKQVVDNP